MKILSLSMPFCSRLTATILLTGAIAISFSSRSRALPPPEDKPEEVLRTEIITDARSPIDGSSLSAAQYANLQEQLQNPNDSGVAPPKFREAVFLLQIRRLLKPILPIIP